MKREAVNFLIGLFKLEYVLLPWLPGSMFIVISWHIYKINYLVQFFKLTLIFYDNGCSLFMIDNLICFDTVHDN